MDYVEKKANTVEEAVDMALEELNVSRSEVDVEIISEKTVLKKATVRVSLKKSVGEKAQAFLTELASLMNLDVSVSLDESNDSANVKISGPDSGTLIGYRGDVLDAVQYLTLLISNGEKDYKRVVVDAENYRDKRAVTLNDLAKKLADKAARTGRRIELEPMNPFERRIIHSALQDSEKATTESRGEEPNRYVVIIPKKSEKVEKKYDPYAPCEDAPKSNFAKTGFKRMRSFGYKRGR